MKICKNEVTFSTHPPIVNPTFGVTSDVSKTLFDAGNDCDSFQEDGVSDDDANDDEDVSADLLARSLVVEGVDEELFEFLEATLENKKKGGGEIEALNKESEWGVLVTYVDING